MNSKLKFVFSISNCDIKICVWVYLKVTPSHLIMKTPVLASTNWYFSTLNFSTPTAFHFSSIFRTYSQCKQSVTNKIIIIAFRGTHGERKMMMTQPRKLNIVCARVNKFECGKSLLFFLRPMKPLNQCTCWQYDDE